MPSISRVSPDQYDAETVRRVADAAAREDGRSPVNEATLLSLRHRGLSGSSLWVARDGRAVAGFALASDPGGIAPVEVSLVVAPSARRSGVGRALAETVLETVQDRAVRAWSHGNHPGAARLAAALGCSRVRDLWLMRRPLSPDQPLAEVALPAGVVIRRFVPGSDENAFLALNAEAFVHHPEQGALTRDGLEQRMAEPWFDASGFFLAEPADAPATDANQVVESPSLLGFHWTKVHDGDPPYGEVYVVGVSPSAQGMGLGKVLTLAGLHHLRELGLGEVILYVEADNEAAVAMYTGLGFTHADRDTDVMYARSL